MASLDELQIKNVITQLSNPGKPVNGQEVDYSIYATAMRTVIAHAQPSVVNARVITEELLPVLRGSVQGSVDNMDVLIALIQRFGSSFTAQEVLNTEQTLLSVLQQEKGLVQKRSITALGVISRYLESKQYVALISYIQAEFANSKNNYQKTKNLSLLCSTVARADMGRFKSFLPNLLPVLIDTLSIDLIGEEEDESAELAEVRDASLQALEVFSDFDNNTLENYVQDLLTVCKTFLAYDPNFFDDEEVDIFDPDGDISMNDKTEEDNEDEDDFAGDDEYDIDENAFSDDEDLSWKLRRHAAVLTANLTKNIPGSLPLIYDETLKLLIARSTKEREETVKIALLDTIAQLVQASGKDKYYYTTKVSYAHKRKNSDASMFIHTDPRELVAEVLPVIVRYSVADLNKPASVNLKHAHIQLLTVLVNATNGTPEKDLERIVTTVTELAGTPSTPFLSDLLKLVTAILTTHDATVMAPHLATLTKIIITGISDSYYRTTLEGLDTAQHLFPLYKQTGEFSGADLMATLISKFSQNAFDIETRKQAIHALGGLVSSSSLTQAQIEESMDAIYDQLDNELLRIDALKAISQSASEVAKSLSSEWVHKTSEAVSVFLKQSSVSLRSEALNVLHALLKITASRTPSEGLSTVLSELLVHAKALDAPSAGEIPLIGTIFSIFADTIDALRQSNSPVIGDITKFALYLLSQDFATSIQKQLLGFFNKITSLPGGGAIYDEVAAQLLTGNALVPAVVATCIVNGGLSDKLDGFVSAIDTEEDPVALEKALQVLGNVGKRSKVSIPLDGLYKNLDNSSDKVRIAAAVALGNVISGNLNQYLDQLLAHLSGSKGKNGYLYLLALRDVVLSLQKVGSPDATSVNAIWDTLFSLSFKDDMSEEGEKALVAECIGRLSILDPERFLPALKEKLGSGEVSVRRSVVSGVKYTFGLSLEEYDRLLRPIIVDFLALMEDPNMGIRQVALGALTSAIHNKPHLLLPHLSRLLPLLYKETVINESLIRTVQMGPFKHKVDDGLDLRKAAYESMFTLATALPREWQFNLFKDEEFISRVLSGLDDEHDIRILSCVTIARIVTVDVTVLGNKHSSGKTNMEELIDKFSQILQTQLKDNALKQEVENQGELERNVVRACSQIDKAISGAASGSGTGSSGAQSHTLEDMDLKMWRTFVKSKGVFKTR